MSGCRSECGSIRELVELLISNMVNQMIDDGKLSEGLKSCAGVRLRKDAQVVRCDELIPLVQENINNNTLLLGLKAAIKDGYLELGAGENSYKLLLPGVTNLRLVGNVLHYHEDAQDKTLTLPFVSSMTLNPTSGVLTYKVGNVETNLTLPFVQNIASDIPNNRLAVTENGNTTYVDLPPVGVKQVTEAGNTITLTRPDNSTVVIYTDGLTPRNIGKTIQLSELETGKYDVNHDKQTIAADNQGTLGVQLSKQPGNMLSKRSDGLYLGYEASPDYRMLHVDAENGDDNNKGTRAAPLRTLGKAISLGEPGTTRNIRLRELQVHNIGRKDFATVAAGTLNIYPYGEHFDALQTEVIQYQGSPVYVNDSYKPKRPILQVDPNGWVAVQTNTAQKTIEAIGAPIFINNNVNLNITACVLSIPAPTNLGLAVAALPDPTAPAGENNMCAMFRLDNAASTIYLDGCTYRSEAYTLQAGTTVVAQPRLVNHRNSSVTLTWVRSDCETAPSVVLSASPGVSVSQQSGRNGVDNIVTQANAKTRIIGVSANDYAYIGFTCNLPPVWFK